MFGPTSREIRFGVVISSSHFIQHFLARLIPPLIPVLEVALGYPLWKLGLFVSMYSLGSGIAQAPLGVASDRYDRIYLLPTGLGIAGASYLLFVAAPLVGASVPSAVLLGITLNGTFLVMSLAMLVLGIGTAVTHPVGYPMISDNVSEENKGKILGAFGSSSKFGDAAAPAAIAGLMILLDWVTILVLLGSLGIVYSGLLFWILQADEYRTTPAALDETRNEGPRKGRTDSVWNANRRSYLYPLIVVYFFFLMKKFADNGLQTFFPAFMVGVYAYTFDVAFLSLGPESVANAYFSLLLSVGAVSQLGLGSLTDRLEPRTVLLSCLITATLGLVVLGLADLNPISVLLVLLILGAGLWGLNPARDALVSEITPPEREGRTFGYIWTAVQMTGMVIPAFIGYIMESVGYRAGFAILAAGTALGAAAIGLLFLDRIYVPDPEKDGVSENVQP